MAKGDQGRPGQVTVRESPFKIFCFFLQDQPIERTPYERGGGGGGGWWAGSTPHEGRGGRRWRHAAAHLSHFHFNAMDNKALTLVRVECVFGSRNQATDHRLGTVAANCAPDLTSHALSP